MRPDKSNQSAHKLMREDSIGDEGGRKDNYSGMGGSDAADMSGVSGANGGGGTGVDDGSKAVRPRQYKCGACNEEGHNARNCHRRLEQKGNRGSLDADQERDEMNTAGTERVNGDSADAAVKFGPSQALKQKHKAARTPGAMQKGRKPSPPLPISPTVAKPKKPHLGGEKRGEQQQESPMFPSWTSTASRVGENRSNATRGRGARALTASGAAQEGAALNEGPPAGRGGQPKTLLSSRQAHRKSGSQGKQPPQRAAFKQSEVQANARQSQQIHSPSAGAQGTSAMAFNGSKRKRPNVRKLKDKQTQQQAGSPPVSSPSPPEGRTSYGMQPANYFGRSDLHTSTASGGIGAMSSGVIDTRVPLEQSLRVMDDINVAANIPNGEIHSSLLHAAEAAERHVIDTVSTVASARTAEEHERSTQHLKFSMNSLEKVMQSVRRYKDIRDVLKNSSLAPYTNDQRDVGFL